MLKTKSVREKDRQRARDVKLKREREAEGDEFAEKEMFVTSAYKKHQQELEEQAKHDEKNGKSYASLSVRSAKGKPPVLQSRFFRLCLFCGLLLLFSGQRKLLDQLASEATRSLIFVYHVTFYEAELPFLRLFFFFFFERKLYHCVKLGAYIF